MSASRARQLLTFALCTIAALRAQTAEAWATQCAALERRLVAERATLAEAAMAAGLLREAGVLARQVVAVEPEHAVSAMLAKLKAIAAADFVRTYRDASKRDGRAFGKRSQKALQPIAAEFAAIAEAAAAAKDATTAERCYARAFASDADHDKAFAALRKLDYDVIFNYGVLPREKKQEARASLQRVGGRFLGRADLAKELECWSDAWGMQTRHYRFVTNAPHDTVFAFASACEDQFDSWQQWMAANKQPLRDPGKPSTVYLFASRIDYESVLRLQGFDPPDSDDVLGIYDPESKVGCFFCDDSFYAGDQSLLFETFFHEGAHQLFDLRAKWTWRGKQDQAQLHWVEEGTCVYLESLVLQDGARGRKGVYGTLIDDDLAIAIQLAGEKQLMPMAEFAHLTDEAWDAYEAGYPHAGLLVHWLLHGDAGKRANLVFELLASERQHGGLRKGTLFDLVGMPADKLDLALQEYARKLDKELTRRKYVEPPAEPDK